MVNQNADIGRYNKKVDLLNNDLGQVLIFNRDEKLPEHGIQVQRLYKKGNIQGLGDCYVTMSTYQISHESRLGGVKCFRLEIMPFNSKTKLYKFLINSIDLEYYFEIKHSKTDAEQDLKLLDIILKKLQLKRQKVYSAIELPISRHVSLPNPDQSYHLRNQLRKVVNTATPDVLTANGKFLEPKAQDSRVILQKVKRMQGQYLVITIERHRILDQWSISIYNPKSSRRFVTSFYMSDLLNMTPSYLTSVCPTELRDPTQEQPELSSYLAFCEYYEQIARNTPKPKPNFVSGLKGDEFETAFDKSLNSRDIIKNADFLLYYDQRKPSTAVDVDLKYKLQHESVYSFMEIKVT